MNIMLQLFTNFENKGIQYVHFKSNKNLALSFLAKGDFDVLVDKRRLPDIEKILIECNAKRYNKPHYGVYPGVDNWLLFDENNGNIYHLHLHYQLASGKKLLKEYTIPWADFLFETRIKDPEFRIYISSPEAELLLLTVRTVIKSHMSDYLKAYLGLYKTFEGLQKEREDLVQKSDESKIRDYAVSLFLSSNPDIIADAAIKPVWSSWDFLRISRIVRKELSHYRRFSPFVSFIKSTIAVTGDRYNKFLKRSIGCNRIEKKVSKSGGLIVSFVGVDGAGKSITKDQIYKWLRPQIECRRFYMGTGDGKVNIFAYLAKKIVAAAKESSQKSPEDSQFKTKLLSFRNNPSKYLKKTGAALIVYSVEKSNYRKIIAMNRYRLEGGVSLLDRFPQIEVERQNDGPKIIVYRRQLNRSGLLDILCRQEKKLLGVVREIKPDIVFRLNISAETAMKRKKENKDIGHVQNKIDELNSISFQNAHIIDVDAEQPYEQELILIKKKIWEFL